MSLPPASDLRAPTFCVGTCARGRRPSPVAGGVGQQGRVLTCLEVGAGPGGPSLWLAAQGHRVTCSNYSNTRGLAEPLHSRFPEVTTIDYRDVDMTDIPWESHFDVIVFRSVLGGVQPVGSGEPAGGDRTDPLGAQAGRHPAVRGEHPSDGVSPHRAQPCPSTPQRSVELPDERAVGRPTWTDSRRVRMHHTGVLAMFGLTESQRTALAAADEAVFNRLPRSWRYVAFGVATK